MRAEKWTAYPIFFDEEGVPKNVRNVVQNGAVLVPKIVGACAKSTIGWGQFGIRCQEDAMCSKVQSSVYPGGLRPATLLQPLQTLAIVEVQGATKVLQAATGCYKAGRGRKMEPGAFVQPAAPFGSLCRNKRNIVTRP